MLTYYERDKIFERIGTDSEKLKFAQTFDVQVEFSKDYTRFFCSGIFQIGEGEPILILPWFLKNNIQVIDGSLKESEIYFFDFIKQIKYFLDSSTQLNGEDKSGLAFEILVHSFLKKLEFFVLEIIRNNFFVDVEEDISSIKGKWNIARDLRKGVRPLRFDCNYSSVNKNIYELKLIKGACLKLFKKVRSFKNKIILDNLLRGLDDVDAIQISRNTCLRSSGAKNAITLHKEWPAIFQFIQNLATGHSEKNALAGLAYKLPVDKFFEEIIYYALSKKNEVKVTQQVRTDLLGGSTWVSQDGNYIYDESLMSKGQVYSIPDIFIETDDVLSIVECKYKPLRIKYLNDESTEPLKSFNRDDRNQLFSFLLSVQPSLKMRKKRVVFNVVFPTVDVTSLKRSTLAFPYSKLSLDNFSKNVVHRNFREKENSEDILKFHFIGLNVAYLLDAINKGQTKDFVDEFLNHLTVREVTEKNIVDPETKLQERLKKRLSLANVIVDEGRTDKYLGRTKMAKILFLSDSLFNLDLGMTYQRAAAGPLDMNALVNDRIGIEKLADKYSYFKTIKTKKVNSEQEKYSYIPGVNLDSSLSKSDNVLVESIDAIKDLIRKLKPLNTEQSEIVATLYGCWNDLLYEKDNVSDNEIIDDFLNNWHDNKKRFSDKRDVLQNWIEWMRRHEVTPIGDKYITNKNAA